MAGIDLNKARNRHVVDAVIELSTKPDGFTVSQLAEAVRPRSGQDANAYSARNAAYDVAKLVGKKLLRRIDRSRRYAVGSELRVPEYDRLAFETPRSLLCRARTIGYDSIPVGIWSTDIESGSGCVLRSTVQSIGRPSISTVRKVGAVVRWCRYG